MRVDERSNCKDKSALIPRAVVFDWDGVFSFAKQHLDRDLLLSSIVSDETGKLSAHGDEWRTVVHQIARERYPDNIHARYDCALTLACRYLETCLAELTRIYHEQKTNVLADWTASVLDFLSQYDCKVYICSGTILEEVIWEAKLAGLASKIDSIWGYPVRKMDFIVGLAGELNCDPAYICLVDDSRIEVESARELGFSAILVKNTKAKHSVAPERKTSFHTETTQNVSFRKALGVAVSEDRMLQPQTWIQEFLGNDGVLLGQVNTRFNKTRVWRVRNKKTKELFYCKVLNINQGDVEKLGEILVALSQDNLPVPALVENKSISQHYIRLSSDRCVVLEEALPGQTLTDPYPNDTVVSQCAIMLAKIHQSLSRSGPAQGTFRQDFLEGLDSIDRVVDAFWHLLIYCQYQVSASRPWPVDRFHDWIIQRGTDIYIRLKSVQEELMLYLDKCHQQWILGDFNYSNVLYEEESISGIVDLEDVHFGPRELDVLSFCMYGACELHLPYKLDIFVRAYCDHHPLGLNLDALGLIARAIVNVRLARKICKLASLVHLGSENSWVPGEITINYLSELCEQLSDFEFGSR